ncbi:MAG: hypothetical protein WC451_06360 [Patescibacteria group bacterium]|jgi:hypothetical protein
MAKDLQLAPDLYTKPPKTAIGGARFDFRSMELTKAQVEVTVANNKLLGMVVLPAGHRLHGLYVEADDLSEGADIVFDVGILNTYYNDAQASASHAGIDSGSAPALLSGSVTLADGTVIVYGKIIDGSTLGQAGGRIDACTLALMNNVGVDKLHDRIIAIDITTAAAIGKAGTIGIGALIDQD